MYCIFNVWRTENSNYDQKNSKNLFKKKRLKLIIPNLNFKCPEFVPMTKESN